MKAEKNKVLERTEKVTDLLLGMTSIVPHSKGKCHYLLADFDRDKNEKWESFVNRVMMMVSLTLFEEWNTANQNRKFNVVYLVKSSDFGLHVLCFDVGLTIQEYVWLLRELDVDDKFAEWVEKVRYGVLRLSRRSKHNQVPELHTVLVSNRGVRDQNIVSRWYMSLLSMEKIKTDIRRVVVYDTKDKGDT